jgi:hypothetical protein
MVERLVMAFFRNPMPRAVEIDAVADRLRELNGRGRSNPQLARLAPLAILFADGSSIRYLDPVAASGHMFLLAPDGQCKLVSRVRARAEAERVLMGLRVEYADELA